MALKLWQLKHSRNMYQFFITNSWNHSLVLYKNETKLCMNIIINLTYTESSRHISKCKTFSDKENFVPFTCHCTAWHTPHLHPLFFSAEFCCTVSIVIQRVYFIVSLDPAVVVLKILRRKSTFTRNLVCFSCAVIL
jgi:hypothetical protein